MASQAAAILRVVERKRQEKQRAILAKNRQFNLSQQFYADPIAQQPRRSHQGWDAGSDVSGTEGKANNADHRQMADKAYKKWLKKQKGANDEFRKTYIVAGELAQFDVLLWSGIAVLLTGTVVSFVGLGEKGFRTSYLRLLGPILCGIGFAVVIIRITFCCCKKKIKKAAVNFNLKDQLAKVVQVQQSVAVRSIHCKPREGPSSIIPSIHIDPSCDSGMKSSITAATELSPENSPLLSGENVPLIYSQSSEENTPVQHMTTAVIETEWMTADPSCYEEQQSESWTNPRLPQSAELALSPMSLATTCGSTTSLIISPQHKSS